MTKTKTEDDESHRTATARTTTTESLDGGLQTEHTVEPCEEEHIVGGTTPSAVVSLRSDDVRCTALSESGSSTVGTPGGSPRKEKGLSSTRIDIHRKRRLGLAANMDNFNDSGPHGQGSFIQEHIFPQSQHFQCCLLYLQGSGFFKEGPKACSLPARPGEFYCHGML